MYCNRFRWNVEAIHLVPEFFQLCFCKIRHELQFYSLPCTDITARDGLFPKEVYLNYIRYYKVCNLCIVYLQLYQLGYTECRFQPCIKPSVSSSEHSFLKIYFYGLDSTNDFSQFSQNFITLYVNGVVLDYFNAWDSIYIFTLLKPARMIYYCSRIGALGCPPVGLDSLEPQT